MLEPNLGTRLFGHARLAEPFDLGNGELAHVGWEGDAGEATVRIMVPDERRAKAKRRAARELVGSYHERELARLLEHVREGFVRFDTREIDAFGLDDLIHRYKRSARELWKFCASRPETVAWAIEDARERGEALDWWAAGEPRRRRGAG